MELKENLWQTRSCNLISRSLNNDYGMDPLVIITELWTLFRVYRHASSAELKSYN